MPQPSKSCWPERLAEARADGVHMPPFAHAGRLATDRSNGLAATPPSSLRRRGLWRGASCSTADSVGACAPGSLFISSPLIDDPLLVFRIAQGYSKLCETVAHRDAVPEAKNMLEIYK